MVSGRTALTDIETALANIRKEEADLGGRLAALTDRVGKARAAEAEALRDLARFKLEAGGDAVAGRLDQASREARDLIARREAEIAALAKRREAKAGELAEAEKKLAAARRDLDETEDRIEALAGSLKEALAADPAHQALVTRATEMRATAEAAVKKAEQAERDRTEKSTAYEADPLFMYLWKRGFGTGGYGYGGLTRVLDRWVAGLIGYAEARPGYALLNEIPVRLRAHAERVDEDAAHAGLAVEESEDAALARLAGEDLAGKQERLQAEVAELDAATEPARQAGGELAKQAAAYADGTDESYRNAIDALSRSIAGDDVAVLRAEAARTPSPEDERFVARLESARTEILAAEGEAARLRTQVTELSRREQELASVTQDFRNRGWDRGGSTFQTTDWGNLIAAFLLGRISRGDFWGSMERSHRGGGSVWGPTGGGWRPSGGTFRPRGGSFGGGGFRTGGRIGGGGFRTGRKF